MERWTATPEEGDITHVALTLHRRNEQGLQCLRGIAPSTEGAIAGALGRPRLVFATRDDDVSAATAAFRGVPFDVMVNDRVIHFQSVR